MRSKVRDFYGILGSSMERHMHFSKSLLLLEELSIFLQLIKQLTLRHIYNLKSDKCVR